MACIYRLVFSISSAMLFPANLKVIESLFRDIAARSFGSSASIPLETLELLPKLLRTIESKVSLQLVHSGITDLVYSQAQATISNEIVKSGTTRFSVVQNLLHNPAQVSPCI